jgi:hypothetical protein
MQVGRPRGGDKIHRLNYACLNKECPREKGYKSIRGKLVFDEIDKVIKDKLSNLPDTAYDEYLKEIKTHSDSAKIKLRSELTRAKATKAGYEKRIAELSPSLAFLKDARAKQTISEQIAEASQFVQQQEQLIEKYKEGIERSTLPAIDKDEFKSTLKELSEKLKAAHVVQKDIIVSNLFLKLHFDQQKMTHYSLKEPFASLVELNEILLGGAGWNRTIYQVVMSRLL